MKRTLKLVFLLCLMAVLMLCMASCGFNPLENLFSPDTAATVATDPAVTTP